MQYAYNTQARTRTHTHNTHTHTTHTHTHNTHTHTHTHTQHTHTHNTHTHNTHTHTTHTHTQHTHTHTYTHTTHTQHTHTHIYTQYTNTHHTVQRSQQHKILGPCQVFLPTLICTALPWSGEPLVPLVHVSEYHITSLLHHNDNILNCIVLLVRVCVCAHTNLLNLKVDAPNGKIRGCLFTYQIRMVPQVVPTT